MTPEVYNAILTLIGALLLFGLGYLIKKLNDKTKERVNFVLEIVENFIKANPDLVKHPWEEFRKKIEENFEKYIKIDLSDEQWELFWDMLYEVYAKAKVKLQEKE